jgi:hypothetical protein
VSRMLIRRNTNYANNQNIPTLDLTGTESFNPPLSVLTPLNLGSIHRRGDRLFRAGKSDRLRRDDGRVCRYCPGDVDARHSRSHDRRVRSIVGAEEWSKHSLGGRRSRRRRIAVHRRQPDEQRSDHDRRSSTVQRAVLHVALPHATTTPLRAIAHVGGDDLKNCSSVAPISWRAAAAAIRGRAGS